MPPEEYMAFEGLGLAELVHRREVTPSELAEAAIRDRAHLAGSYAQSLGFQLDSRGLERRRRGGGDVGHGTDRSRHGLGGIDPRSGRGLRSRGIETQPRVGAGRAAAG